MPELKCAYAVYVKCVKCPPFLVVHTFLHTSQPHTKYLVHRDVIWNTFIDFIWIKNPID